MDKITELHEKFTQEGYARLLGLRLVELREGYARVTIEIKPTLQNIFHHVHGGAIFSLIDEAFELACNSHVEDAVAMSVTVNYIRAPQGTTLSATAQEIALTRRTGIYDITVHDESDRVIAVARALCYRKESLPKVSPPPLFA